VRFALLVPCALAIEFKERAFVEADVGPATGVQDAGWAELEDAARGFGGQAEVCLSRTGADDHWRRAVKLKSLDDRRVAW